jgi:hypothetical protein
VDLNPHVAGLRGDVDAVVGDEPEIAARLGRALEPAFRVRLLDALGEAALEITEQLPNGRVDVRLAGSDIVLTLAGTDLPPPSRPPDDDPTARLTLRMPEGLKAAVERAADADGISTNAWLVDAISRALDQRTRRRGPGRRLTGYADA